MEQRKTVHKWFWVWEFEKEERWLNTMAQSGWLLDSLGFCTFHFVACQPGEYAIRLEMRDHDEGYLSFMADMGAEYVGRMVKWIYFRKKLSDGPFDLYSDMDSRISLLNRIGTMLTAVGMANLVIGVVNSMNPTVQMGWVNLLAECLLMYALGRIHGKKEALEAERVLHE